VIEVGVLSEHTYIVASKVGLGKFGDKEKKAQFLGTFSAI